TGTLPDGGPVIDGNGNGYQCQDDSMLEPNDTLSNAYVTPIDSMMKMIKYAGLAICPKGDKDTYHIDIGTNLENLDATVTPDGNGAMLSIAVLTAGGTPIATSQPVTNMPGAFHAVANNLPPGTFFVQVTSADQANYKLQLTVTGP